MLRAISSILSRREWGVIRFNSVLQNIFLLFFIGLSSQLYSVSFISTVFLFLLLSFSGTTYGYLINDYADLDLDRRAGKPNAFINMRRSWASVLVITILMITILLSLAFIDRPGFFPVFIVWLFFATFYSLPPIRLKERGVVGLSATILAEYPLPMVLALVVFGALELWGAWIVVIYITFRGISAGIGHQMRDREYDEVGGATTLAARVGHKSIAFWYGISLEAGLLGLGLTICVFIYSIPPITILEYTVQPIWLLAVAYVALLPLTFGRAYFRLKQGEWVDPYNESAKKAERDALQFIHNTYPTIGISLFLALILSLFFWPNLIFVFFLILVHQLFRPKLWLNAYPFNRFLIQFK
jgi:4-hydroxybenzoate polyprenyltransferase